MTILTGGGGIRDITGGMATGVTGLAQEWMVLSRILLYTAIGVGLLLVELVNLKAPLPKSADAKLPGSMDCLHDWLAVRFRQGKYRTFYSCY